MSEINEIGARLRELREVSEYTVEQVAAELGLEPEPVSYTHLTLPTI